MSKQKTKIAKIVINIAGEELELSPKQAKELRDILCDLYGDNVIENHHYHDRRNHNPWQYWYPSYTTVTSGNFTASTGSPTITANTTTNLPATSSTLYLNAA